MTHPIDPRIFRAYDIRGIAHEQITPHACRLIGHAFGSELRERYGIEHPKVAVGRDARTHGPELEDALIEGLVTAGCHVMHIGMSPSPVNYFTVCTQHLDGGVQVTASHNPGHDNGLKFKVRHAHPFFGEDVQALKRRIDHGQLLDGTGEVHSFDGVGTYIEHVTSLFPDAAKGLRIAVDSGNGVAGPAYTEILRRVGADVTGLYIEPDGTFPNHPADPSKHVTLKDLQATVREHNLDIGLAFDGDGDRLGLVDETGAISSSNETLLVLAKDYLSRHPGAPVVFTVSNSGILTQQIKAWGGKPVMCKVGTANVEEAMTQSGAQIGGELSGHLFTSEGYFPYDDAMVAALRILSTLRTSGKTYSQLLAEFPKVHAAPERRPFVPDDHKGRIVQETIVHFSSKYPVETLDGLRIDFEDGSWFGLRQSNTSPCISVCIEATSPQRLLELEAEILGHLKKYPEIDWDKH